MWYSLASVKAPRRRGSCIENITYERLHHYNHSLEHRDCRWFRGAIYIDQFYSHEEYDSDAAEPIDEGTPIIRNIFLRDIETETIAGNAIFLQGLSERHLDGVRLENIRARDKTGLSVVNADGVVMKNVSAEIIYRKKDLQAPIACKSFFITNMYHTALAMRMRNSAPIKVPRPAFVRCEGTSTSYARRGFRLT